MDPRDFDDTVARLKQGVTRLFRRVPWNAALAKLNSVEFTVIRDELHAHAHVVSIFSNHEAADRACADLSDKWATAVEADYLPQVNTGCDPFPAFPEQRLITAINYSMKLPHTRDLRLLTGSPDVFLPVFQALTHTRLYSLSGLFAKRNAGKALLPSPKSVEDQFGNMGGKREPIAEIVIPHLEVGHMANDVGFTLKTDGADNVSRKTLKLRHAEGAVMKDATSRSLEFSKQTFRDVGGSQFLSEVAR